MSTFLFGGQSCSFEDIGAGEPVLLIHGFTNHGLGWAPQLAALVSHGFRILLPDLPGHGRSYAVEQATGVDELARSMIALLDHLGIARAHVCGLSLGGMVAQELALMAPERVNRLVIACSTARANDPATIAAAHRWIEVLESPDGPLHRLAESWPFLTTEAFRKTATARAVYDGWQSTLRTVSGTALAHIARALAAFDAYERLGAVAAPTLVIGGGADKLFPPARAYELVSAIPGARLALLQEAGHLANLDSPDQFNSALLAFLTQDRGHS